MDTGNPNWLPKWQSLASTLKARRLCPQVPNKASTQDTETPNKWCMTRVSAAYIHGATVQTELKSLEKAGEGWFWGGAGGGGGGQENVYVISIPNKLWVNLLMS